MLKKDLDKDFEKNSDNTAHSTEETLDLEKEDRLSALSNELNETKNKLLRSFAEIDNMSKRFDREKEDIIKYSVSKFAKAMLTVMDNFEMAISSINSDNIHSEIDNIDKSFIEGIKITKKEIDKIFAQFGIKKIESIGQKLDPNLHQAIQQEDSDAESGTIISVMQDGYTINDRILRPALVKTAK